MISRDDVVLFQGDSITDCERDRSQTDPNSGLGNGYAHHVACNALASFPTMDLKFYNRGVSRSRIVDLYARWRVDGINLKPSLISILIGINDIAHHFSSNNGVELPRFERVYQMLLEYTREQLPDARLILCEPFAYPCGVVQFEWLEELPARASVIRELATQFNATFVPFQSLFDDLLAQAPAQYWLYDGVHPSLAGHFAMANFWLKHLKA